LIENKVLGPFNLVNKGSVCNREIADMLNIKAEWFTANVAPVQFVQDNESKSARGVLRGLHFQTGAFAQAKLVRVLQGEVLDVAVDLRQNSPTFGQHFSILLS
jgi:dTDP-4-dehydrorhamnose 3,5-epimerase